LVWDLADELTEDEKLLLKNYNLLTFKPFVYAVNISEDNLKNSDSIRKDFEEKLQKPVAIVCAKIESELLELDDSDKVDYFNDLSE